MSRRICILMGAPGSGKGTQAKRLSKIWSVPHISTGDMLRAEIAKVSPVGQKVKAVMDSGQLIGDQLMTEVLRERLSQPDTQNGFVLDGYPRTVAQGDLLMEILGSLSMTQPKVVLLELEEEQLVKRLTGRLTCQDCGAILHRDLTPSEGPCPQCGGKNLIARDDDDEETVVKRLKVYETETAPLIQYFEGQVEMLRFKANQAVEALTDQIVAAFG
ncbi:MAG: adenylate kinase [Bradymonadales bacterium]|nr:MAG: adenylate kinase [Bradymonadales bacterium]